VKKNKKFNLSYLSAATVPIFMIGFKNHSIPFIILASLLLAFLVIGGVMQAYRQNSTKSDSAAR
jgi:hypothetical protein